MPGASTVLEAERCPASAGEILNRPGGDQSIMPGAGTLTPRQVAVLKVMAEGVTEREVARRLGISERAVQLHVANICRALGVRSHVQLGVAGARLGFV